MIVSAEVKREGHAVPPLAEQPALQLIYETAPIGLAFLSSDCRYLYINQHLTEICGISIEGHLGRTVRECVPGLADAVETIVGSILATGRPVTGVEVTGQRAGQNDNRTWVTYWHPLRGPEGEIIGINVAAEEITERKRAQTALQVSERQFRILADAIPQLVWMSNGDGRIFWCNRHWYEYTGADENGEQDWLDFLAPEPRFDACYCWMQALDSGTALEVEVPLRDKGGQYRLFLTRIIPLRDSSGALYRWIGTHVDISEQRRREEHVRFVVDELSHRTKNLLTVVMAIANQTAQSATDIKQYRARLLERLRALAQCHDILVRDDWHGASLHGLVEAQMRPFGGLTGGRIDVEGPDVILKANAVQYLGLALHELATNASKHGSLSGATGTVRIGWKAEEGLIVFHWRERNGPAVTPPKRRGFGHVVIEQIVPRALNGHGALEFPLTGVQWSFCFEPAGVGGTMKALSEAKAGSS